MRALLNHQLTPYIVCPIAWILTWWFQSKLTLTLVNTGINLIFLPAGVRTLSVFVFGLEGAIGVFIGTLATSLIYFTDSNSLHPAAIILVSLVSAFTSYLTMVAVCKYRRISNNLNELKFSDVLLIVLTQGLISPILHLLTFHIAKLNGHIDEPLNAEIEEFLYMSAGDIVGSMIFMLAFVAVASFIMKVKDNDADNSL